MAPFKKSDLLGKRRGSEIIVTFFERNAWKRDRNGTVRCGTEPYQIGRQSTIFFSIETKTPISVRLCYRRMATTRPNKREQNFIAFTWDLMECNKIVSVILNKG